MDRQEFTELWIGLEEEDTVVLRVSGSSMYPFLRNQKDYVYLKKISNTTPLKKGDILLYVQDDGKWILHRLWKKEKNGNLVMVGDAQSEKETIRREQVVAVTVRVKRGERDFSVNHPIWKSVVVLWRVLYPYRQTLVEWKRQGGFRKGKHS